MTEIEARVLDAARALVAAEIRPTIDAVHRAIVGRARPSRGRVVKARLGLVAAGLWPAPPRPGARPPGSAAARRPAEAPDRRDYLGPFAADLKRLHRLRREQRALARRPEGGAR